MEQVMDRCRPDVLVRCVLMLLWATLVGCGAGDPVWDVVVVGSGPAGLAAAWDAEQAGARVLVIEGRDEPGGRARWGSGVLWFAGTGTQRDLGIDDDPERGLADWPRLTGGEADPWAQRFVRDGPVEVHDWLVGLGLRFQSVNKDFRTGTWRTHLPEGGSPGIVAVLLDQLRTPPRTGVWAEGVERRPDGLLALRTRQGEGRETLLTRSVVLATGSLLADAEQVSALAAADPCPVRPRYIKEDPPAAGPLLGLEVRMERLEAIGAYAHLLGGEPWTYIGDLRGLWVDSTGRAFFDTTRWTSIDSGLALRRQAGCAGWMVFDDRRAPHVFRELDPSLREELLERGEVLWSADALDELAQRAGIDPEGLVETVSGLALPGQGGPGRRASTPAPPTQPPYWAVRLGLAVGKHFGGVSTDLDGRVLDPDGRVIPGVFAAGELTGMAGGSAAAPDGMDGSLGLVLLSGRVAGRSAAAWAAGDPGR
jgi:hypothetical protein